MSGRRSVLEEELTLKETLMGTGGSGGRAFEMG